MLINFVNDLCGSQSPAISPVLLSDLVRSWYGDGTDLVRSLFLRAIMILKDDFMEFAQSLIDDMARDGVRTGTRKIYSSSFNSFKRFYATEQCRQFLMDDAATLRFSDMTGPLMVAYQSYLFNHNRKLGTVSCYMRYLRAIYNKGVRRGLCKQAYPFKDVYTSIPKTDKRALSIDVLLSLLALDLSKKPKLSMARDFFFFSFAACGMAFVDIVRLRKTEIVNGYISYKRYKSSAPIDVKITPFMQEVIDRYSVPGSPYVFPFLHSLDQEECDREYKNSMNWFNRQLGKLGELLPALIVLTSYMARHSWATLAHELLVKTAIISSCLGHSSERTTQIYLANLDSHKRDVANELITGFLWKGPESIKDAVAQADAIAGGKMVTGGFVGGNLSKKETKQLIKETIKETIKESIKELFVKGSKENLGLLLDFLRDEEDKASADEAKEVETSVSTKDTLESNNKDVMNSNKKNSNNNSNNKKNNSYPVTGKQMKKGAKVSNLLQKKRQNQRAGNCGFLCKKSSKSAAKVESFFETSKFSTEK